MITREQIRNLLDGVCDRPIAQADADQMAADYPYFAIPQLLYLKYTPGAQPDEQRIQQALLHASPGQHLETILGIEGDSFADLYPKAAHTDTTMQAIDLFLGTYQKSNLPTEESLDKLISGSIIAQTDYMSLLHDSSQEDESQQSKTAAQPGTAAPAATRKNTADHENMTPAATTEPATDDTFFTESLAKIYIKQRRYEKALQIIKKLSLKYPEKNIYFADQIRFLEKLIINTKTE